MTFLNWSIELIHPVANFLGTVNGELFKKSIELILYILISYMIISEYTRSHRKEYRYLSYAFVVFSIDALFSFVVLSLVVFANINNPIIHIFAPILNHFFELSALILVATAFMHPFEKKRIFGFGGKVRMQIAALLLVTVAIQILWWIKLTNDYDERFTIYPGYLVYQIIKIALIAYTIIYILHHRQSKEKYQYDILLAFLVYGITPILRVLIYATEGYNISLQLNVVAHPFPIFSALLFTRVVYLKLADKAYLEKQLELSKTKIQAAQHIADLKDEFVSTVSHELRTPLTSMKLYTSLMRSKKFGDLTEKQENALRVIDEEANRLNALISDILDLSKLDSGKAQLHIVDFDLVEFVRTNPHYELARQHQISILAKLPTKAIIRVDPDKFKQVFLNILSNAIKFTATVDRKRKIWIHFKENENDWELTIRDNGPGIDKKKLNKLFDKFYQAEEHMTRTQKGTGLGLTIAKKIMDMHGGNIKVQSEISKGSSFTLSFPKQLT